ncbi:MAG: hypothetical protein DELT_02089 [Desulfovibrio sp.]
MNRRVVVAEDMVQLHLTGVIKNGLLAFMDTLRGQKHAQKHDPKRPAKHDKGRDKS